jgi:hypothetical protein
MAHVAVASRGRGTPERPYGGEESGGRRFTEVNACRQSLRCREIQNSPLSVAPQVILRCIPSGEGVCEQLPDARVASIDTTLEVSAASETVLTWILNQARLGPHSQPTDPSELHLLDVHPPDVVRKYFWDPTRTAFFASTVSRLNRETLQCHSHTIRNAGIQGCTLIRDVVIQRNSVSVWSGHTELRAGPGQPSWLLGLIASTRRRGITRAMRGVARSLEASGTGRIVNRV